MVPGGGNKAFLPQGERGINVDEDNERLEGHVRDMRGNHGAAHVASDDRSLAMAKNAPTKPTYHPSGGDEERRIHADGVSYWRGGERHNATGFAVFRNGVGEAWLFGHQLPIPDHPSTCPLMFAGQTQNGQVHWGDADGSVRAVTVETVAGVHEVRWYTAAGDPEEHWRGAYHVLRVLGTGERRYYHQPTAESKPLLHRVDGPAIEDPVSPARSIWCEGGAQVHGPLELLIQHTIRAKQAGDHGRLLVRLELTDVEKARLQVTLLDHPDSDLAVDIAIAFPDVYAETADLTD